LQINAYNSTSKINNTSGTYGPVTSNGLGMQDFLNLIIAQMTNQDPMSPMKDTEFISQMAQFSSLQAMTDLREVSMQGQAANLIGKNVIVADYDSKGQLVKDEGVVQKVVLYNGSVGLYVNDKEYGFANIMEITEVKEPEQKPPEDDQDKEPPEDGTVSGDEGQ
jgi:flagellar basal-body rod modification protein FlgD